MWTARRWWRPRPGTSTPATCWSRRICRYNIVGHALNGHADVDDVVQDTMVAMVRGLPGVREPERFRSWVVAIAVNEMSGARRHRAGTSVVPGTMDELAEAPDPAADFVGLAILRLGLSGQRRETAEATRWLGPGDRELLALWWLEAGGELTREELATAAGLTPEHAAVRVQRVKERLQTARTVVRALRTEPCCPQLSEAASGWDGQPSALWRKRLARHVRECAHCGSVTSQLVPAERLLVGLGLVPSAAGLGRWASSASSVPSAHAAQQPYRAHMTQPTQPAPHTTAGTGKGALSPARHRAGSTEARCANGTCTGRFTGTHLVLIDTAGHRLTPDTVVPAHISGDITVLPGGDLSWAFVAATPNYRSPLAGSPTTTTLSLARLRLTGG
ncbi:sigma-70 family RNA polymerase sigma factor [Streptomyces montanus]|uniref:sigma-70 family RNA polymerase sigma factor n=1 Tax=Streptomyces montanus TaxID=2580423 RepID=UPI002678F734